MEIGSGDINGMTHDRCTYKYTVKFGATVVRLKIDSTHVQRS